MSPVYIPRPFLKSCQQHDVYPAKLVERARYGLPLLLLYQERFNARQRELNLFAPAAEFFVPYWDVSQTGRVDQKNLRTERELGAWLGDNFELDPQDVGKGPARVLAVKSAPRCRFM